MSAKRFSTKEKANIEIYGGEMRYEAHLSNVSQTGALLNWTGRAPVKKGDLVRISIPLHEINKHKSMSAEVVWTKTYESGVEFIPPDQVIARVIGKK